jgi:hypothetical protein
VPPPPGPDDPHPCHCAGGYFNPRLYAECERCRKALAEAIRVVRLTFPGARIVATPGIPIRTSAGDRPAREEEA